MTYIRNTATWEFAADRAVDHAGHGEHGGWSISQESHIICACGETLFPVESMPGRAA